MTITYPLSPSTRVDLDSDADLLALAAAVGVTDDAVDWRELAACRETDPEVFHPESGDSLAPAQRICAGCPVRERCLEWALDNGEDSGVWGGMAGNARRRLRRARAGAGEAFTTAVAAAGCTRRNRGTAEKAARVAQLTDAGLSAREISAETGWSMRHVVRLRALRGDVDTRD